MPTISVYLDGEEYSYVTDHDSNSGIIREALREKMSREDGEQEAEQ